MSGPNGIKKRGRPRTGWAQVGVKLLPDQAAQLDDWIARQPDRPKRPEAIRRLLDLALPIAASSKPSASAPFNVGGRVHADQFGNGRVVSPPQLIKVDDPAAVGGRQGGSWMVEVQWDAAEWGIVAMHGEALVPIDP